MSGVDPVMHWIVRLALALLFAVAAWHKLRDLVGFTRTLRDYRVLPSALSLPGAAILVSAEACAAVALLLPALDPLGPATGLALLGLYSFAIAWNLARGRRHIDCGCLGPGRRQPIGPGLLLRNGALCLGALLLLAEPTTRAISWIDALSLVGSLALLVLLWNAAHELAAAAASRRTA